jgi:RNA polymerase sigma-70 factor (ECF subfamily)
MTSTTGGESRAELQAAYARLAPSLFRYALMLLANHHEAEDAVQQVFIALATRGTTRIDSLDRYLRTSVRNECYSALGRRRDQPPHVNGLPLLEALPAAEDRTHDRLALEQGLRSLPPEQREAIHLKVFEGHSFQEVADLTGESINTIASRYRYGMDKLRVAFGAEKRS